MNPYAQVAAGLQQQQQQFHQRSLSAVAAAAAAGGGYQSNQAAAAAAAVQQHLASTQHGAFGRMSAAAAAAAALGGHYPEMSGLELLSRAAQSAGGLLGSDDMTASRQLVRGRQALAARSSDNQVPKVRQPTHTL
jgi:hypothetical protein